jgi:hypothetical protein
LFIDHPQIKEFSCNGDSFLSGGYIWEMDEDKKLKLLNYKDICPKHNYLYPYSVMFDIASKYNQDAYNLAFF